MGHELKWRQAFEHLQSVKAGRVLRSAVAQSMLDKRHPAVPKWFDAMWAIFESGWVLFFIAPWCLFVLIDLGLQIWIEPMGSVHPSAWDGWGLAMLFARACAVGALCLASGFCMSMASKTSWRSRWCGPKECKEAQSLAAREPLCRQWLDEALPRGLRCIDLEAMRHINQRQLWVSGNKALKASELATKNQELKAYAEMNQRPMEALSEARDIAGILITKDSVKKQVARRL